MIFLPTFFFFLKVVISVYRMCVFYIYIYYIHDAGVTPAHPPHGSMVSLRLTKTEILSSSNAQAWILRQLFYEANVHKRRRTLARYHQHSRGRTKKKHKSANVSRGKFGDWVFRRFYCISAAAAHAQIQNLSVINVTIQEREEEFQRGN